MEAEINRVRSECENKIEILSRNSCDISLEHKYEKLFEAKVNEFEDTVRKLKADILKLRQENNSLKSKILLLENSFSKETSGVCENNNLAPVTATNISNKTINTIVNERPSNLMGDSHIKSPINNEVSQANKNSATIIDTLEHLSDLNISRSVCTKTSEAHKKPSTNSQVNSSVNNVEARNNVKLITFRIIVAMIMA